MEQILFNNKIIIILFLLFLLNCSRENDLENKLNKKIDAVLIKDGISPSLLKGKEIEKTNDELILTRYGIVNNDTIYIYAIYPYGMGDVTILSSDSYKNHQNKISK